MIIEIITTGNEILTGLTLDTNFQWAAERLTELSFDVRYHTSVIDDKADIIAAFKNASTRADGVIVSGGLGPTDDDITGQCAADFFDVPLELDSAALGSIEERFRRLGREVRDLHRKMAMIPEGSRPFFNNWGTAPGFMRESGAALFFFLPGVPKEFRPMVEQFVIPELEKRSINRQKISITLVKATGLKESEVAERLEGLEQEGVYLGYRVADPEVHLRVVAKHDSLQGAEELADGLVEKIRERLGSAVFSVADESLEEAVGLLLKENNLTLALAESCTGGLVSSRITDIPGSSQWFERGIVVYSNEAKIELLGVPAGLIEELGAVSAGVVEKMALGVRNLAGTDIGLGISGIAGPGGGSDYKPVGTVFFGLSAKGGTLTSFKFHFNGTRKEIKYASSQKALELIRQYILDNV